jgi:hypothetical protein
VQQWGVARLGAALAAAPRVLDACAAPGGKSRGARRARRPAPRRDRPPPRAAAAPARPWARL